jgi:Cystatin domain
MEHLIYMLCIQVRQDLENKAGRKFTTYKALEVASQVVNGTNYFVKVSVLGLLSNWYLIFIKLDQSVKLYWLVAT